MFDGLFLLVTSLLPMLVVLLIVVTIHELGHFGAGKLFGVKIERFSIGFGKPIWSRRDKTGVEWCLAWIPLGGYVKFAGDEHVSSAAPSPQELEEARQKIVAAEGPDAEKAYYHFKPVWQRAIIAAAGPVANFVLAIIVFAVLFGTLGMPMRPAQVMAIQPGSAAEQAGFKVGDILTAVDGRKVESDRDARLAIMLRADSATKFEIRRDGQPMTLIATPTRKPVAGQADHVRAGVLGVQLGGRTYLKRFDPLSALGQGVIQCWRVIDTNLTYIGRIFTGKESGDQISGVLGMTKVAGETAREAASVQADNSIRALNTVVALAYLLAVISVGIGFLNLLPIPILDGGHLVFYAYEAIFGKPIPAAVQAGGYRVGLVLVLGLFLFATWNDLRNLSVFKFIGSLL